MRFPRKFQRMIELKLDDVTRPDEVRLTYAVCACFPVCMVTCETSWCPNEAWIAPSCAGRLPPPLTPAAASCSGSPGASSCYAATALRSCRIDASSPARWAGVAISEIV